MKFFRNLTIRAQLTITSILTILIVILIILFSYSKFSDIMVGKNRNYTSEITSNIQSNIALYFREISSILRNIGYDTNTQKYVMEKDPVRLYETGRELKILSINTVNIKKDIIDIVVIGENGKYFTMSGMHAPVKNLMAAIPTDGGIYNTGFEKIGGLSGSAGDDMFFMYGMYIYSAYKEDDFGERIGFASLLVNLKPIFEEISKFSTNTEIKYYLIDKKGQLFSEDDSLAINNKPEIQKRILNIEGGDAGSSIINIDGSDNLVQVYDIPEIEGRIVSIVPQKELLHEIYEVRKIVLIICLSALVIVALLFLFIINNITHPVNKLISFMNKVKRGDIKSWKDKIQLEGYSEIKVLSNEFNNMMSELNSLTHRLLDTSSKLYEAELEKKKAEFAYLRSQINPHFLYNTLEALKGIALDEGQDKIFEMTRALALIFRYCVHDSSMVALEEELKIITAYVKIHEIRSGERLRAQYAVDDGAKALRIPKMILQPLVENAIYHGLEPKRGRGTVHIGGGVKEGELRIDIRDDGVGIPPQRLERLKKSLSEPPAALADGKNSGSIGLYNVNNRIKLSYGNSYGLSIASEIDRGTEVVVSIPIEEGEDVQGIHSGR